jgi:hypothetical protein
MPIRVSRPQPDAAITEPTAADRSRNARDEFVFMGFSSLSR